MGARVTWQEPAYPPSVPPPDPERDAWFGKVVTVADIQAAFARGHQECDRRVVTPNAILDRVEQWIAGKAVER